jgi:phosphatidylserine/phosphatidylglycerophosphate/cardiolipin synthase-like enzyme
MRKFFIILIFILILGGIGLWYLNQQSANSHSTAVVENSSPVNSKINAYFSPNGGCTEAIINEIRAAQKTICVQAYSFTSEPIADALIKAHKRGVDVEIVLDKSQKTERYSKISDVAKAGIPTFIDSRHAIAHNKIMIIDSKVIITGSFNFTKGAEEKNAENLLIIKDQPDLVRRYEENYLKHKGHSEKY